MKVRILGCGPSYGLPAIDKGYGLCNPNEPKNNRTRSAALVFTDDYKKILIDCGPELRLQLLKADCPKIDAVLITHAHYDHIGGADDLRFLAREKEHPLHLYLTAEDDAVLMRNTGYIFEQANIEKHIVEPYVSFQIGKTHITPVWQGHGSGNSIGYRIDNFAYSTDAKQMDEQGFIALKGINTWIMGLVSPNGNIKHIGLNEAYEWIDKVKPEKVYLTHMGHKMDYETLLKELPPFIRPVYDGMEITI